MRHLRRRALSGLKRTFTTLSYRPGRSNCPPSRGAVVGFKTPFYHAGLSPGAVELPPFRGGYCGLVRIENGLTNACLLADYNAVAGRSPAAFWQWLLGGGPGLGG